MKKYMIAPIVALVLLLPAACLANSSAEEAYGLITAISDAQQYLPLETEGPVTRARRCRRR